MTTVGFGWFGFALLLGACGGSSGRTEDGTGAGGLSGGGGSAVSGASGAGASGAGGSAGKAIGGAAGSLGMAGDTSGAGGAGRDAGGTGGAAGAPPAGEGGDAGAGAQSGDDSGGSSGVAGAQSSGGSGGVAGNDGGSAGVAGDWRMACDGLTLNGRCSGNVYEWCDYFDREVKQLDCTPLGMTCRANVVETNEADQNGCITETCTQEDDRCEGALKYDCIGGALVVSDCRKWKGAAATCLFDEKGYNHCRPKLECDNPGVFTCNGSMLETCDIDSVFYLEDCARYDASGTCVQLAPDRVECGGRMLGQ